MTASHLRVTLGLLLATQNTSLSAFFLVLDPRLDYFMFLLRRDSPVDSEIEFICCKKSDQKKRWQLTAAFPLEAVRPASRSAFNRDSSAPRPIMQQPIPNFSKIEQYMAHLLMLQPIFLTNFSGLHCLRQYDSRGSGAHTLLFVLPGRDQNLPAGTQL